MSSRLKERGREGGKIIASNFQTKISQDSLPRPRLISARTALVDHKENPRPISTGRPSMASSARNGKPRPVSAGRATVAPKHAEKKPVNAVVRSISTGRPSMASSARNGKPRPVSAGRATVAPKHAEKKPVNAIVRSTSSLSRGKVADLHGDAITRISSFGERRSFSGFWTLDKELAAKAQLGNDALGSLKDASNRYQSNLHEKLALLEGRVQKLALEINHTKDMLDKNKSGKSGLALSDIQNNY
ncbi:hypothetical protein MA16_Dca009597 [Dendrobium catenatum]|uniref:Uncharacterized protein n=1 Tax=Dendrobium catenatum TaxID=906689 RepID=A0A2I0VS44_9ASPA|nr:hypothetical protein MA16_Dca009597 [Dendrobium catenatum]